MTKKHLYQVSIRRTVSPAMLRTFTITALRKSSSLSISRRTFPQEKPVRMNVKMSRRISLFFYRRHFIRHLSEVGIEIATPTKCKKKKRKRNKHTTAINRDEKIITIRLVVFATLERKETASIGANSIAQPIK